MAVHHQKSVTRSTARTAFIALLALCVGFIQRGVNAGMAAGDAPPISGGVPGVMGVASKAMVAACHPESAQAGLEVLKHGGSAMDAFVAATFVDYVVAYGLSSSGGSLGLLVYDSSSRRIEYLNATLKRVADPDGQYSAAQPSRGRAFLVPGAVAGLEAAHRKYGRLPWPKVLAPAIKQARDGFPIPPYYALVLSSRSALLERNDYARQTFFKNGKTLETGQLLRQPLLAQTLEGIAHDGANYFYRGKFAGELVDAVNTRGGKLTLRDLGSYQPVWLEPIQIQYRGYDVFVPSQYSRGGAELALALRLLEHIDFKHQPHWTLSANTLIAMVKIFRVVESSRWVSYLDDLADPERIREHLSQANTDMLWHQLSGLPPIVNPGQYPLPDSPTRTGSHSYHIVVVDEQGNIVTGTHTLEAMPWTDDPIFVGGIALNDAGKLTGYSAGPPGGFTISLLAPYIIERAGTPAYAGGTFGSSLFPADMQVVSNLIDFDLDPGDAVLTPRFGTYSLDLSRYTVDRTRNWLDPRFPQTLVEAAGKQQIRFDQGGSSDTGSPVVVEIDRQPHRIRGMVPERLGGYAIGY